MNGELSSEDPSPVWGSVGSRGAQATQTHCKEFFLLLGSWTPPHQPQTAVLWHLWSWVPRLTLAALREHHTTGFPASRAVTASIPGPLPA